MFIRNTLVTTDWWSFSGVLGDTHRSLSQEIIRKHYTVAALAVIGRVTNTRIFLFNVRYGSCGGAVSQSGMEGLCQ